MDTPFEDWKWENCAIPVCEKDCTRNEANSDLPYCEEYWNELYTTKCVMCGFPIEAGDRWVEALNNNYHSQCFNCTVS